MDSAVALVQAYLRINGYFTVTEYPVFAPAPGGGFTTATDLDVLAFRFPGAGRPVVGEGGRVAFAPDPALNCPADHADMLIGEVKEGKAELNSAARQPRVLAAVLARFGCCPPETADSLARALVRKGHAATVHGHRVRLVAFGAQLGGGQSPKYLRLTLGHLVEFLREHLDEYWPLLGRAQLKDPAMGFLLTLEKARRAARGGGDREGSGDP